MTRDEVLARLRGTRAEFDRLLSAIPTEKLGLPVPGGVHSPKDIVFHVAAYDDLMVKRFRCARDGINTEFDRDRAGWEAFNNRIWAEAAMLDAESVFMRADETFLDLLEEVSQLTDADLAGTTELAGNLDPGWLKAHPPWEMIGVDGFDHYPMHFAYLEAAAR